MCMSNAYERLISLCENAGIPAPPKSVAAAEMRGYAAGAELLYDMLDRGLANVFVQSCDKAGLAEYCSLLLLVPAETEAETRAAVIERLSYVPEVETSDEFKKAFNSISNISILDDPQIISFGLWNITQQGLSDMADFLKNNYPLVSVNPFKFGAIKCEKLDELDLPWYIADGFDFRFFVLDGIAD